MTAHRNDIVFILPLKLLYETRYEMLYNVIDFPDMKVAFNFKCEVHFLMTNSVEQVLPEKMIR